MQSNTTPPKFFFNKLIDIEVGEEIVPGTPVMYTYFESPKGFEEFLKRDGKIATLDRKPLEDEQKIIPISHRQFWEKKTVGIERWVEFTPVGYCLQLCVKPRELCSNPNWTRLSFKMSTENTHAAFLPFQENYLTFMEVTTGCNVFFTGPIEGCQIYGLHSAKSNRYWFVHVNANGSDAKMIENVLVKDQEVEKLREFLQQFNSIDDIKCVVRLSRMDYSFRSCITESFFGAWKRKEGTGWDCYVSQLKAEITEGARGPQITNLEYLEPLHLLPERPEGYQL